MTSSYLLLILLTLAIGGLATLYVNSQLNRYKRIPSSTGLTGVQAAQLMLQRYGLYNVAIYQGRAGQNFFDPRTNSITLDIDAYHGTSITSIATACHECGHACQFAQDYTPMRIRSSLVPVVNMASNTWMFVLLAGIFLGIAGFVKLAIALYAFAVIFELVTLPVEFNASNRALAYLNEIGIAYTDKVGVSKVLRACAYTYVAAALTSILQLLWLLGQVDRN